MNKTALIIGSTGLVGEKCLSLLLQSAQYDKVIALTRKKLTGIPKIHADKLENLIVDFDQLEKYAAHVRADHIYCTMGTTIAKAGSQAAFRKVDLEIPLQVAGMALKNGAEKFIVVTALGADPKSGIFYNKVKGELENALKKLKYSSLIILHPSILIGNRKEKRTGEAIGIFMAKKLSFLFTGPLKKYKGTPVDKLAQVMVQLALAQTPAVRIVENEEIFVLAEK